MGVTQKYELGVSFNLIYLAEKSQCEKFTEWKTPLIPQNLLNRMLPIIFGCDYILMSCHI